MAVGSGTNKQRGSGRNASRQAELDRIRRDAQARLAAMPARRAKANSKGYTSRKAESKMPRTSGLGI